MSKAAYEKCHGSLTSDAVCKRKATLMTNHKRPLWVPGYRRAYCDGHAPKNPVQPLVKFEPLVSCPGCGDMVEVFGCRACHEAIAPGYFGIGEGGRRADLLFERGRDHVVAMLGPPHGVADSEEP